MRYALVRVRVRVSVRVRVRLGEVLLVWDRVCVTYPG